MQGCISLTLPLGRVSHQWASESLAAADDWMASKRIVIFYSWRPLEISGLCAGDDLLDPLPKAGVHRIKGDGRTDGRLSVENFAWDFH